MGWLVTVQPLWIDDALPPSYGYRNHGAHLQESFHQRQGFEILLTSVKDEAQAMCQDAINRWWWPSLMMFGPKIVSTHSDQSTKWKIKENRTTSYRNSLT
jgi:1,2-phenylacetyl-CoA epoxidase catalytic subunit